LSWPDSPRLKRDERRSLAKCRPLEVAQARRKFEQAALEKGLSKVDVAKIFPVLSDGAETAFSKSHGIAQAVLVARLAFLKGCTGE